MPFHVDTDIYTDEGVLPEHVPIIEQVAEEMIRTERFHRILEKSPMGVEYVKQLFAVSTPDVLNEYFVNIDLHWPRENVVKLAIYVSTSEDEDDEEVFEISPEFAELLSASTSDFDSANTWKLAIIHQLSAEIFNELEPT